jgi:DNA-binding SARP family transcriptional activator
MSEVRLRLLGNVELVVDGATTSVGGVRQRAIIALLALHRDRAVPTSAIVGQVWGNDAPRTVVKSLSTMLSRSRRLLAPHGIQIVNSAAGYELRAPAGCVDLHAFRDAVSRSRVAELGDDRARAITELRTALAWWSRPSPLADLDGPFVEATRASLVIERDAATVELARLHRLAGDPMEAVELLEALAAQSPTREDRQVELMRALTTVGRVDEAVAVYDRTAKLLADQLGIEPGPLLSAARHEAASPPVGVSSDPVIGRDEELECLEEALRAALHRDMRVVAITGEPGAGKSHLVGAFVDRVLDRGFLAFVCHCEPTATVPLYALLQIFEQTTGRGLLDARDYPNLRDLLEQRVADPSGDAGDLSRRLLLQEIMEIVLVLAAQGPLIVVIEDFHNADPMTLSVIEGTSYEGIARRPPG